MSMMKIFLIGFCLMLSVGAMASEDVFLDSIGIEKVGDKSYIIHLVDAKETLFGISRRYEVAVNDIVLNNEELRQGLKIGQRIRIPFIAKSSVPVGAKVHKVAAGETLFSISKVYNVTVTNIMAWNNLQGNDLSVGQALVIEGVATTENPVQENVIISKTTETVRQPEIKEVQPESKPVPRDTPPTNSNNNSLGSGANSEVSTVKVPGEWITHTVGVGETLFSVAQKYDAKIENIINWNALSSNNLSVGQKLKVGREPEAPSRVPVITSDVPVIIKNEKSEVVMGSSTSGNSSTTFKNIKEAGMAEVIEGTGNHKKYLVLHRDAPVGTIMRVRNEENDITIFARVVGKLPETGDNSKLVIKLSKAAFDQLRAVNSRFPVEISY